MFRFTLLTGLLTASLLFAPGLLRAETLVIRNQTGTTLTVQSACVVRGMVRPQRPVLLQPGGVFETALPGNKLISVYDPRLPNRSLLQSVIEASCQNQLFVLGVEGASGKLKLTPVRTTLPLGPESGAPSPVPTGPSIAHR